MLRALRDAKSAERFFRKALKADHNQKPRVINVDKNAAYPKAVDELKADQSLPKNTELRPVKYLNNVVKQDHRFIKRLVNLGMGNVAHSIQHGRFLRGYEAMSMIRKGQIQGVAKGDIQAQVGFVHQIFGVVA